MSAILTAVRAIGLADALVLVGLVSALAGSVTLFGWPVTLLSAGLLSLIGGIVLAHREGRS